MDSVLSRLGHLGQCIQALYIRFHRLEQYVQLTGGNLNQLSINVNTLAGGYSNAVQQVSRQMDALYSRYTSLQQTLIFLQLHQLRRPNDTAPIWLNDGRSHHVANTRTPEEPPSPETTRR